jgi:cysteine sulfinate desulfinase/cysteine desulfurase-like protein
MLKSTENVSMIAGLGKAADLVSLNLDKYATNMKETRDYLENRLKVDIELYAYI